MPCEPLASPRGSTPCDADVAMQGQQLSIHLQQQSARSSRKKGRCWRQNFVVTHFWPRYLNTNRTKRVRCDAVMVRGRPDPPGCTPCHFVSAAARAMSLRTAATVGCLPSFLKTLLAMTAPRIPASAIPTTFPRMKAGKRANVRGMFAQSEIEQLPDLKQNGCGRYLYGNKTKTR